MSDLVLAAAEALVLHAFYRCGRELLGLTCAVAGGHHVQVGLCIQMDVGVSIQRSSTTWSDWIITTCNYHTVNVSN